MPEMPDPSLFEQEPAGRPLADRKELVSWATRFADFLQQHFNAGERGHGVIAWVLGVVPASEDAAGSADGAQAAH